MKIITIIIISFISFFISNSQCKDEQIEFNIDKIEIPQASCIPNLGAYLFYLKGEFNKSPIITNDIAFNLESSNFKVICYPLEKTSITKDQFQCTIDICDTPINNQELFLPIIAPNTNEYIFPNWKEKIGSQPGITNKITTSSIRCIPNEINSFNITSFINQGCSDNKNIITIEGNWLDEDKILPSFPLSVYIDLLNNKMIDCKNVKENIIQCNYDENGKVKLNDVFFKNGINVFKIKGNDISIDVKSCEPNSSSFILFKISTLFFLILLLK